MGEPVDVPSTGPPDRQTLQLLERSLATNPLIEATAFEPDVYEPRLLRAEFDTGQFSTTVDAARLDIRWFTSGDFSIHYIETDANSGQWECRWDRHPNEHNDRVHFHHPPNGDDVTDLSLPSLHPLSVYSIVLEAVEQRLTTKYE